MSGRRIAAAAALAAIAVGAAATLLVLRDDPYGGSLWTTPLPDDAALDPDSAGNAARLARQARYTPESTPVAGFYPEGFQSVIKMADFSVPVYVVPEGQPRQKVTWVDDEGLPQPAGVAAGLQATFDDVPLPTGIAQLQADGTDGHLVVHQPSTDTLWEFWTFRATGPDGASPYVAGYGARIDDVSRESGRLPNLWGARATSLSLLGGVVRMTALEQGSIDHALAVALPVLDDRVVLPATRTDGPSSAVPGGETEDALSAGMRFRLPADYDCRALEGRGRLLPLLCAATRDYGMVVVDRSGGTVTLYAEDDRTVGTPWSSVTTSPWPAVQDEFAGPDAALTDFPWEALQQVAPPGS